MYSAGVAILTALSGIAGAQEGGRGQWSRPAVSSAEPDVQSEAPWRRWGAWRELLTAFS